MKTAICQGLLIALMLLVFPDAHAASDRPIEQPNIIFIFADDWGYGDLGIHGLMLPFVGSHNRTREVQI